MPQHKSAKKRVRTNERKHERNKASKSRMRNIVKELRNTTEKVKAEELYKEVSSVLDRSAAKGLIHKNTAAQKKAKLAKHIKGLH